MSEQGLKLADVIPSFEDVGGKAVAEGVTGDAFVDVGAGGGVVDDAIECGGIGVPADAATGLVAA